MDVADPEGRRLPIKIDSATNGETLPIPLKPRHRAAIGEAQASATINAGRLGLGRRSFLTSLCGAASTLLAFNRANAAMGASGGFFDLPHDAALEEEVAASALAKRHFIFDVQTHHFNPPGNWGRDHRWSQLIAPMGRVSECLGPGKHDDQLYFSCFTSQRYLKDIFLDSDTEMAVLSLVPSTRDEMPLSMEEAARTREAAAAIKKSQRLMLHGRVIPTQAGDLDNFVAEHAEWGTVAAKTYTQFHDAAGSFWLDDHRVMDPLVRTLESVGIDKICIHKGQTFPSVIAAADSAPFASCRDVGPAARMYPGMNFLVYHSGYETDVVEGPHDPAATRGTDTLIRSLVSSGVKPGSNVYAEIGATWRYLMKDPDQASHLLGKLLLHVGEDNILWGTDSMIFGSPQDQIHAFQTFQISEAFQERFGYPGITDRIRAKIFGLNAARIYGLREIPSLASRDGDAIARARQAYAERADPDFLTYGPRTRSEFLQLARTSTAHDLRGG